MNVPRVSLVSPVEDGIRVHMHIGHIDLNTDTYTPPDLRDWQHYIDAGWTVQTTSESTP